jgi:hemolysin III
LRKTWLKDPFCGISHFVGAVLAIAGMVFLIVEAKGNPWAVFSFAIYGATLFVLYLASALYHSLRVGKRAESALYGFDRAAIFALIAGTYTPICLIALPAGWGYSLFGVVWLLAATGIIIDIIARRRTPDWLQAVLYLATGWVAIVAIRPLIAALPPVALGWLAAGCIIYSVGAVICVTDWPKIKPGVFSAHELWHVLVIAGSICHFVLMVILARGF